MEGVYRVNGGQLTMKKLRTSFDQGKLSCVCLFITTCTWHQIQSGDRRTFRIRFHYMALSHKDWGLQNS